MSKTLLPCLLIGFRPQPKKTLANLRTDGGQDGMRPALRNNGFTGWLPCSRRYGGHRVSKERCAVIGAFLKRVYSKKGHVRNFSGAVTSLQSAHA